MKNKFVFDDAFKEEPDLDADLKRRLPEGINVNFKNVGDKLLDAVLHKYEGFLVGDYYHLDKKFMELVMPAIKEGKVVYVEDIDEGLESISPRWAIHLSECQETTC